MRKCYVYEHWRLDKDECFYVGFGSTSRRAHSKHDRNKHWKNIVKKLESNGSTYEVKIVKDGLSKEDALNLEIERISFWRSFGIKLSNMTNGGEGNLGGTSPMKGKKHSDESREKLRKSHLGKSSPKKGIPISDDQKQKMSNALRGRIGVKSMLGKNHNDETKIKMSEAQIARWAKFKEKNPTKIKEKKPKNKVAMAAHLAEQKLNPIFEEKRKAGVRRAQQTKEYREKMRINALKRWHKEIS
jgi:hypothetical protein